MAKKAIQPKNTETETAPLPSGFRSLQSGRADCFFNAAPGAEIQGILLGRYARRDKPGFYVHIKLTAPCGYCVRKGNDGLYEPSETAVGDVVSIDERASMAPFIQLLEESPDRQYEVFIRFRGKEQIDRGHTVWRCDVGAKPYEPQNEVPF